MLGIENIGIYIPDNMEINTCKIYDGEVIDDNFLTNKIGVINKSKMPDNMDTSDMCVEAVKKLLSVCDLSPEDVQCICVCTQNGDYTLPHTSAIVHAKLMLDDKCAFYDISLGCSGYVYGLKNLEGFMLSNGLQNGILVTCDPYSKIIDFHDKNTDLLFGDAATATLLTSGGRYVLGRAAYNSASSMYDALIKRTDKALFMDGRKIYNFALRKVPELVQECMEKNSDVEIDGVILHHASKYVVDSLARKLKHILPTELAVQWDMDNCGNTVSSSIPIELAKVINSHEIEQNNILLCGFGVGLSAAAVVVKKRVIR